MGLSDAPLSSRLCDIYCSPRDVDARRDVVGSQTYYKFPDPKALRYLRSVHDSTSCTTTGYRIGLPETLRIDSVYGSE